MAAAGVTRLFLRQHSQRDIQFLHILISPILPHIDAALTSTYQANQHAEDQNLVQQMSTGGSKSFHQGKLPFPCPTPRI